MEEKFFKIPSFLVDVERFPGHPHDTFVVVVGTPGYATTGSSEREGGEPAKEIYENGLNDDTRVLSVRLPGAEKRRYTWDLQYDLIPNNRTLMLGLAVYWVLAVILGIVSISLPVAGLNSVSLPVLGVVDGLVGYGKTVSAGFLTATIGLIFALDAGWTDRYKVLSILPLLLHGMAWFLWTFPDPTTT
ncbi:hypothetical protein ACFQH6_01695 [Halobacteriaceae archaeon GCM10025711]